MKQYGASMKNGLHVGEAERKGRKTEWRFQQGGERLDEFKRLQIVATAFRKENRAPEGSAGV